MRRQGLLAHPELPGHGGQRLVQRDAVFRSSHARDLPLLPGPVRIPTTRIPGVPSLLKGRRVLLSRLFDRDVERLVRVCGVDIGPRKVVVRLAIRRAEVVVRGDVVRRKRMEPRILQHLVVEHTLLVKNELPLADGEEVEVTRNVHNRHGRVQYLLDGPRGTKRRSRTRTMCEVDIPCTRRPTRAPRYFPLLVLHLPRFGRHFRNLCLRIAQRIAERAGLHDLMDAIDAVLGHVLQRRVGEVRGNALCFQPVLDEFDVGGVEQRPENLQVPLHGGAVAGCHRVKNICLFVRAELPRALLLCLYRGGTATGRAGAPDVVQEGSRSACARQLGRGATRQPRLLGVHSIH
mmetsp:Transcript_17731/g.44323  ORF Transcript_17731/g.44323 Transcript_17731/m.44323 type:complete len:347 (+) Transcript_17731:544-1584(+)